MLQVAPPHVYLQSEQQSEEELVRLIESATHVLEHPVGEEVNDVVDPLQGDRGPLRPEGPKRPSSL